MAHTAASGFRYAPGLDGIRALAVAAVFVYHVGTTGTGFQPLRGGFLGVDVFFVLSGYLITTLLLMEARKTGTISIPEFYKRRARRLLPAAIALMLVVAGVGAFWLQEQASRLMGDLVASLVYMTNWWLILQESSYFGGGERPPLLTHLWSLAVEEQFYVLWPLVLILFARKRASRALMLTLIGAAIIASTVAAALLFDPWGDPSRVYYGTDTRAATPLLGAALAIVLRPWRQRDALSTGRRVGLDLLGVAALAGLGVVAVLLGDNDPLLYQGGFLVISLLAAALVASAGHPATWLGKALGLQPLRWLGQRSYALYLWHWPVCTVTRPGVDIPLTGWENVALRVGIVLVLAELSYWLVERPLRRPGFFRPRPSRHAHRAPRLRVATLRGPAVTLVLTMVAASIGWQLTSVAARAGDAPSAPVDAGPELEIGPLELSPSALPTPSGSVSPSPAKLVVPASAVRVAVFGDSQGMTLLINKPSDIGKYLKLSDETIEGCGILLGRVTSRSGERRDLMANCRSWESHWRSDVQRTRPAVALVMLGAWDVFDLTTPAGKLTFASPGWDAAFNDALTRAIGILIDGQAKVALALLPCYRPIRASAGFWPERGDDTRTRHINDLLRAAAASDPARISTVDPPGQFCTDPKISTSKSYRWDGVHYYKAGAALYFKAVTPQLVALHVV